MHSNQHSKTVAGIITIINNLRLLTLASKGYNRPCSLIFAALVLFTGTQAFSQVKSPAPIKKGLEKNLKHLKQNQRTYDESMGKIGGKANEPLVRDDKSPHSYSYDDWYDDWAGVFDFAVWGPIKKTARYASYLHEKLPDFPYEGIYSGYEKVRSYFDGIYQSLPALKYDNFNYGMQQAGTAFQYLYDSLPEFPYESLNLFTQFAYEQGGVAGQFLSETLQNGFSFTREQISEAYSAVRPWLPGFPQFNNVGDFMTFAGDTTYRRYFAPSQLLSPQSLLGSLAIMLATGYSNVAIAAEVASLVTNPVAHMVLFTLTTAVVPTAISSAASYTAGQRLGSEQVLVNEPTVRKRFILEFNYAFDGYSRVLTLYPVAALPGDTAELPEPWNKLYSALMSNNITSVQLSWDTHISGVTTGILAQYTQSRGQHWVRRAPIKNGERMDENIELLLHHEMSEVISEKKASFMTSSLLHREILFDTVIAFASPDNKKHRLQADDLMVEMISTDDRSSYVAGLCAIDAKNPCMHHLQLAWSYFPYPHYTPFIDVGPIPSSPVTGLEGIIQSLHKQNKAELLLSAGEKTLLASLKYRASHMWDFSGGYTRPTVESSIIQAIRDNDLDSLVESSFQPPAQVWLSTFKHIASHGKLQHMDPLYQVFKKKGTDVLLLVDLILEEPELDSRQIKALLRLFQKSTDSIQREILERFMEQAPGRYVHLASQLIEDKTIVQLGAQLNKTDSAELHTLLQIGFMDNSDAAGKLWRFLGDEKQTSLVMHMLDTAQIDLLVSYLLPWGEESTIQNSLRNWVQKPDSKVREVINQLPKNTVLALIEPLEYGDWEREPHLYDAYRTIMGKFPDLTDLERVNHAVNEKNQVAVRNHMHSGVVAKAALEQAADTGHPGDFGYLAKFDEEQASQLLFDRLSHDPQRFESLYSHLESHTRRQFVTKVLEVSQTLPWNTKDRLFSLNSPYDNAFGIYQFLETGTHLEDWQVTPPEALIIATSLAAGEGNTVALRSLAEALSNKYTSEWTNFAPQPDWQEYFEAEKLTWLVNQYLAAEQGTNFLDPAHMARTLAHLIINAALSPEKTTALFMGMPLASSTRLIIELGRRTPHDQALIEKVLNSLEMEKVRHFLETMNSSYHDRAVLNKWIEQATVRHTCQKAFEGEATASSDRQLSPKPLSLECSICLETFKETVITHCGHSFCRPCITEFLRNDQKCPLCRGPVSGDRLIPNRIIEDVIEELVPESKSP